MIYQKYAFILTVIYIAFLFGPGAPILFPIALLSLLSLYVTERLCMAYVYQRPPIYTTALNDLVLRLLAGAPVLYVAVAAWLYSNQQVFRNTVVFNKENYLFPHSDHTWAQFRHQVTPGTFYLLALLIYAPLVMQAVQKWFVFHLSKRMGFST